MSSFHDLVVKRRSIRRYTTQPLSAESVKLILEAGLMAPTSKNCRAWRFIAVDDRDTLQKLSECKHLYGKMIANAALAIVVAVDEAKDHCWIEDSAIAATYMQLQAADLGLGSCWVQIRDCFDSNDVPAEERVRELLQIPDEYPVVCVLAFGHKDEERKPQAVDKLLWEQVSINKYQAPQE